MRSKGATVATVAATASRPTSAALGAVVSVGPEPMTGQGHSASGSSAWSTVFRHVRYENLVAGVSGGVLSNLALHPLDLVKIRFAGKSPPRHRAASSYCQPELGGKDSKGGLNLLRLFRSRRRRSGEGGAVRLGSPELDLRKWCLLCRGVGCDRSSTLLKTKGGGVYVEKSEKKHPHWQRRWDSKPDL